MKTKKSPKIVRLSRASKKVDAFMRTAVSAAQLHGYEKVVVVALTKDGAMHTGGIGFDCRWGSFIYKQLLEDAKNE